MAGTLMDFDDFGSSGASGSLIGSEPGQGMTSSDPSSVHGSVTGPEPGQGTTSFDPSTGHINFNFDGGASVTAGPDGGAHVDGGDAGQPGMGGGEGAHTAVGGGNDTGGHAPMGGDGGGGHTPIGSDSSVEGVHSSASDGGGVGGGHPATAGDGGSEGAPRAVSGDGSVHADNSSTAGDGGGEGGRPAAGGDGVADGHAVTRGDGSGEGDRAASSEGQVDGGKQGPGGEGTSGGDHSAASENAAVDTGRAGPGSVGPTGTVIDQSTENHGALSGDYLSPSENGTAAPSPYGHVLHAVGASTVQNPLSHNAHVEGDGNAADRAGQRGVFERIANFVLGIVGHFVGNQHGGSSSPLKADPRTLTAAAQRGFTQLPGNCSGSVAIAAAMLGHHELSNKTANAQVVYMRDNWREVAPEIAWALANGGNLVVLGWENVEPGKSGHTAIVTPGDGRVFDGVVSPNVTGGGSPLGRSNGTKTAHEVFRAGVHFHFYTP